MNGSRLMTLVLLCCASPVLAAEPRTAVAIEGGRWTVNGEVTYPGAAAEGLLMNVRMVNAVFEDAARPEFDAAANTDEFIDRVPEYVSRGVRAFTIGLQGGMPGYEGAVNSAFAADGSLRDDYMARVRRVIEACDRHGAVVILGCFYQRQDQHLRDEAAVRAGVTGVATWVKESGFGNVLLEIANEYDHPGFDHPILKTPAGQVELIRLVRVTAPTLPVSSSGLGHGRMDREVAEASDFILIHFNSTPVAAIPGRVEALRRFGKPIVCNEDDKTGAEGVRSAEASVAAGASWGLMLRKHNQTHPFAFDGAADDPAIYDALGRLTTPPDE